MKESWKESWKECDGVRDRGGRRRRREEEKEEKGEKEGYGSSIVDRKEEKNESIMWSVTHRGEGRRREEKGGKERKGLMS